MSEENNSSENTEQANQAVALDSFYGVKEGMTRIFNKDGNHVPVTVVKLIPNFISQVKTEATDGYNAYQVAFFEKREKLLNNPVKGKLKKAGIDKNLTKFYEVRLDGEADSSLLGKEVSIDDFSAETVIDVTGVTKGKGFAGFIKRHNFSGGPGAHGSKFHRSGGSIGNRATPGRVWKNKKMPGHMGQVNQTIQNLSIVEVNKEKGYLLIRGSIPGGKNGFVKISKAMKAKRG